MKLITQSNKALEVELDFGRFSEYERSGSAGIISVITSDAANENTIFGGTSLCERMTCLCRLPLGSNFIVFYWSKM